MMEATEIFMVQGIREFLQTKPGKILGGVVVFAAVVVLGFALKSSFGDSEIVASSKSRIAVCSETGKSFEVAVDLGTKFPVKSPYSGRDTGYEFDEVCGWTADGKVAEKPTYVLLNKTLQKKGPTFCPVCHRLVVAENPPAEEGKTPPPTESEYAKQNKVQ